MNHLSENAARLELMRGAAALTSPAHDPFGSATVSMRWARPARDGLLLVSAAACGGLPPPTAEAFEGDAPRFDLDRPVWHPLDGGELAGMHGALLQNCPDADSIVMVASPYAATLACTRDVQYEGIPFFHPMVALAGRDRIDCCPVGFYAAMQAGSAVASVDPVTGRSPQDMILDALGDGNACLVAHYGLLTLGGSPAAAVKLACQLEALCQIYWQVLQVGGARAASIPSA
ncbi:MAG: class II aldolase/adducin family protein [Lautropia sp.]|nr:class II aldolase/adducin family protein [Lautropia sp.]